jgi:spermidine synthase
MIQRIPAMSIDFEELDYRQTPLGELSLRRRKVLSLGVEVFEVKLGNAFLMSSLFHKVEVALADLGLAELEEKPWDVVVGGLGLGYTAAAALEHAAVRSLLVVEALEAVIEWHQRDLVPLGKKLTTDPRCRFVHGDFFSLADSEAGFDLEQHGRQFHAVLLDIDHSPSHLLHPRHAAFYQINGLRSLAAQLYRGGVFALWSDYAPDEVFLGTLETVFGNSRAHIVTFANPLLDSASASTVYVAQKTLDAPG